jgi:hypoxanthine phosphoribosyltransferase
MEIVAPYSFITTRRLAADAALLASALPPELDAVVGIARSGIVPAAVVATLRQLPLFSASRDGRIVYLGGGARLGLGLGLGRIGRGVALIDDTAVSGGTFADVRPFVQGMFPAAKIFTAAVYATAAATAQLDGVAARYESPHYLEWNFWNSCWTHKAAVDFDGILCEDCPPGDDDDGPRYARFLAETRPKAWPRLTPISAIVTARLEKYRAATKAWLDRWGIRCPRLIMGPWATLQARRGDNVAQWKGEAYQKLSVAMFVESDARQAPEIARAAGKPVLCPAAERVFVKGAP